MIRILLSLAIAAAAYFGPWVLDSSNEIAGLGVGTVVNGADFAEPTANCLIEDIKFSINDECEPNHGTLGKLVAGTVIISVVAAALSIIGLLPVIGRLTSIVTVLSGVIAVVTFVWFAKELMMNETAVFSDFRWGAYATGAFGLFTIFAGLAGLRGEPD